MAKRYRAPVRRPVHGPPSKTAEETANSNSSPLKKQDTRPTSDKPSTGSRESKGLDIGGLDVETFAKLLAAVTIGLYVLGLVGVNSYLFSLGASDFTLTRARFIYTGVLISAAFALTLLGPFGAMQTLREKAQTPEDLSRAMTALQEQRDKDNAPEIRSQRAPWTVRIRLWTRRFYRSVLRLLIWKIRIQVWILRVTGALLAALLPYIAFLVLILFRNPEPSRTEKFIRPAFLYLLGLIAWGAINELKRIILKQPRDTTDIFYGPPDPLVVSLIACVAGILIFISQFMSLAYPAIPDQYGGGRPIAVRLLIEKDSSEQAKDIGLPMPSKGTLSNPVQLLYQGETIYVLRLGDSRIVHISSDLVKGLTRA